MAARLMPQTEGSSVISLEKAITLIGRHPDCDGVLPDNQKISRRHCCIAQVENRLILRDLGSMNGVTVNGEQVSEIDLKDGDEITIGDEDFILEVTGKGQGGKSPAKPPKVAKRADSDAPTPEKPSQNPRKQNAATAPSGAQRRPVPMPIDISQEFPVAIPEDDESSEDMEQPVPIARSGSRRSARLPIAPKIEFVDENEDDDDDNNDILKLDSGEIQLCDMEEHNKKKKK
ncbi:MAG: garA 6 [Planctomycetaceae bacterium]|nr:garA 6 [Planctomycetaceae bacterium]